MATPSQVTHISSSYSTSTNKLSNHSQLQSERLPPFETNQGGSNKSFSPSLTFLPELYSILNKSLIHKEPITLSPIKFKLITHPLHRDLSSSHISKLSESILKFGYENFVPATHDNPPFAIKYKQRTEIIKPLGVGQPPSAHTLVPEIDNVPVYYVIAGAGRVEAVEYALRIAPSNQNLINLLLGNQKVQSSSKNDKVKSPLKEETDPANYKLLNDLNGGIDFYILDGSELSVEQVIYLSTYIDSISHQITFNILDLQDLDYRHDNLLSNLPKPPIKFNISPSKQTFESFSRCPSLTRHEDLVQQLDIIISKAQNILSEKRIEEVGISQLVQEISIPFHILDYYKKNRPFSSHFSQHGHNSMIWLIWLADLFCPYFRNGIHFDQNQHKYAIPGLLFPNFATQIRLIFREHISFDLATKIKPETLAKGFYCLISTCILSLNSIFEETEFSHFNLDAYFLDNIDEVTQSMNWKATSIIPLLRLNNNELLSENVTNTWESLSSNSPAENLIHLFQYPSLQGIFHTIGASCVAYFYSIMVHKDEFLISGEGFKNFEKHATIFLSKISELAFKCVASSINLVQCNENYRLRILEAASLLLRFALSNGTSLNARQWQPFPKPMWISSQPSPSYISNDLSTHKNDWITFSTWEDVEQYIYKRLLLNIVITPPHLLFSSQSPKVHQTNVFDRWLERRKPEVMTVVTHLLDSAHRSQHNPRTAKVQRGDLENNNGYELKIIDASVLPMCRDALTAFINLIIPISSRLLNRFATEWTLPATAISERIIILPAFIPIFAALRICCSFIPPQFDTLAPESVNWIEARGKLAHCMYQQSSDYIISSLQKLKVSKDSKIIFSMAKDPKFELKAVDMEFIFEDMRNELQYLLNMIQKNCFANPTTTIEVFWQGLDGIRFLYPQVSKVLSKLTNGAEPIIINQGPHKSPLISKTEAREHTRLTTQPLDGTAKNQQFNPSESNSEMEFHRQGFKNKRLRSSNNETENIIPTNHSSSYANKSQPHNMENYTKKINIVDSIKSIISNQKAKNTGSNTEQKCSNLFEEWFRYLPLNDKLVLQHELPYLSLIQGTGLDIPDLFKWKPPILKNNAFKLKHFPNEYDNDADESSKLSLTDWKIITAVLKLLRRRGIDTLYSTSKNISFYLGDASPKTSNYTTPGTSPNPSPDHSRSPSESRLPSEDSMSNFPEGVPPTQDIRNDHLWMASNLKLFLSGIYPEQDDDQTDINDNQRKRGNELIELNDLILTDDGSIPQTINQETEDEVYTPPTRSKEKELYSLRAAINDKLKANLRQNELDKQILEMEKDFNVKRYNQFYPTDIPQTQNATLVFSPYLPTV